MADIEKLYEKAEKYLQKQKFESALETYLEIYKYEPSEEEVLVNLGDLCLRLNRNSEGVRFQSQLTDLYTKRNDTAKAVATCRKILKVAPQDVTTLLKLAALLEKTQKNTEALEAFRQALDLQLKGGANLQAIESLQHIVKLDPANADAHVQLAELASRAHQPKVATPAFLKGAELSKQAGEEDRWAELIERAHSLDPTDEAASIAAAEVYLKKDRIPEVVALLEPIAQAKPDDLIVLEHLARGYLSIKDYNKAEPVCWKVYAAKAEAVELVLKLTGGFLETGETDRALALMDKMKGRFSQQGKRNEYLKVIEKIYESDESNLRVLEMLTGLYNELNKEDGLRRSLTRLFNLYLAAEQYEKAADTLERILDVEPYGEGHYDRLLNLEGHIDPMWYKNIAVRVQPPASARTPGTPGGGAGAAAQKVESLDDLIVEGEMFFQYQLSSKLSETLEKINRLFPGAEDRAPRLRELYDAAGFTPKGGSGAPAPSAAPAGAGAAAAAAKAEPARIAAAASAQSFEEVRKIAEITANIYREGTPQGVMQVAVNEIGRALNASRCWGALGTADRAPALTAEYCSPTATPSDMAPALKVYSALIRQAGTSPDGWSIADVASAPILAPVMPELQKLAIQSLLALPLLDKDEVAGLLLLEQCGAPRAWSPSESLLLKAIATQVAMAVNNTKLRRLVRSLAGTDEESGLLPRSSYIDCLLAEAQRSRDQSQALSVCLLEPANSAQLVKTLGDAAVQRYVQQVGKTLLSSLRQNDVAVRYSLVSIAVVFPDTALPQGGLAVEKVRRVISQVKPDGAPTPSICAAVCDVPLGANFDAVDGVTEVINRLEASLEQARKEGGKRVLLSKFAG